MTDIFLYDNSAGELTINTYEILLIKEFATLWDKKRNKSKDDPKGDLKLRAWKELKYILAYVAKETGFEKIETCFFIKVPISSCLQHVRR